MESFVNKHHSERPEGEDQDYRHVIGRIAAEGICPFCPEHLPRFHPKPIDQETDFWVVTNNNFPYKGTAVHALAIHKQHIESVEEMEPDAWVDFLDVIKGATKRLKLEGASLLMRYGSTDYTGASVAHLHAQIVSGSGNPKDPPLLARLGNMVSEAKQP
jgi:diadenosine tetraphosphate (Ap4A) HIT family hydrolase